MPFDPSSLLGPLMGLIEPLIALLQSLGGGLPLPTDGLPLDALPLDSLPLDGLPLDDLPLDPGAVTGGDAPVDAPVPSPTDLIGNLPLPLP